MYVLKNLELRFKKACLVLAGGLRLHEGKATLAAIASWRWCCGLHRLSFLRPSALHEEAIFLKLFLRDVGCQKTQDAINAKWSAFNFTGHAPAMGLHSGDSRRSRWHVSDLFDELHQRSISQHIRAHIQCRKT